MITCQRNTKTAPVEQLTPELFHELTESPQTRWQIESYRQLMTFAPMRGHLKEEYQKFCLRQESKPKAGPAFKKLSREERMKRFAKELKETLPGLIFAARDFDLSEIQTGKNKGKMMKRRLLKAIHLSGLFMTDVDHIDNPREVFERTQQEDFPWRLLLAHITTSGHGLRLVCVARQELGNIADNQIEMAQWLGVKADSSCIDASRTSFCPKADEVLLLDNELFTLENREFAQQFEGEYREEKTQPKKPTHSFDDTTTNDSNDTNSEGEKITTNLTNLTKTTTDLKDSAGEKKTTNYTDFTDLRWKGHRVQEYIDRLYGEKLPCREDSNRHNESLKLATDLLMMMDGDKEAVVEALKAQAWVKEIIEERGEDVEETVDSAMKALRKREAESRTGLLFPRKAMQQAVKEVTGLSWRELMRENESQEGSREQADLLFEQETMGEFGRRFMELKDDFPMIADCAHGLYLNQVPSAVMAAGGVLMTLMTRCWYRFYHKRWKKRRLNCQLYVIGHPANGKSHVEDLNDILVEPLKAADQAGVDAINRYKEKVNAKADNKEGPEKPKVKVRFHPVRTANGQFIADMVNATEVVDGEEIQLHMYTFDSELDNSNQMQRGGSWIDKQTMELKAFHNEEDGQMYANKDSISGEFNVAWNMVYTGTIIALEKKVNERNFGTGLATRLTMVPMPATHYKMIPFEDEDISQDLERIERMREWAYRLDATKGELTLGQLVRRAWEWTERRMADAEEDQSMAEEMLIKRCAYHGLNFSAPYIVMRHWGELHQEGRYWTGEIHTDERDWQLMQTILDMQFATQMHFFGAMAENYFDNISSGMAAKNNAHYKKTQEGYRQLPEIFTLEDLMRCFSLTKISAYKKKERLLKDGLAEVIETGEDKGKMRKLKNYII